MRTTTTSTRYRRRGAHLARAIAAALLAAAGTFHASDARACTPCTDPNDDQCDHLCVCSYATPTWNAPAGAVVFARSNDVMTPMWDALGEYRTHTMVSTGPNSWVLHNDSNPQPAGDPPPCTLPASGPSFSQPGFKEVSQSSIYGTLYSDPSSRPYFLAYQLAQQPGFAQALLNEINPIDTTSLNAPIPTVGFAGWPASDGYSVFWNGHQVTYDFHSFIAGDMLGQGQLTPFTGQGANAPYYSDGNGGVCSSTAAFLSTRVFLDQGLPYAGGWVEPKTYPWQLLYAGGSLGVGGDDTGVAQKLFESIYHPSAGSLGSAIELALGEVGCQLIGQDVLENAANQVLNCIANAQCGQNGTMWQAAVKQQGFAATSITDDTLGGWNGGPTWRTDINGNPFPEEGASVWAGAEQHTVQWSGDGTPVNCWDMPQNPPPGATGSTPSGDVLSYGFTSGETPYLAITDITPTSGPTAGGTIVNVYGQNFSTTGETQVAFGGFYAPVVECPSSDYCWAQAPAAEYLDFDATVDVVVTVGAQSSTSAPLAPTFQFHYVGTGLTGCAGYWTCTGTYNDVNLAVVTCPIPPTGGPYGTTWELFAGPNASNLPPVSATISASGNNTEYLELSGADVTTTTYEACFGPSNQQVCSAPITLQTHQCGCTPVSCDLIGASCGTQSDLCGGTIDCGSCPAGEECNSAAVCAVPGPQSGGKCVINGTTYLSSASNPANHCQICDPLLSVSDWSPSPTCARCSTVSASLTVRRTGAAGTGVFDTALIEGCPDQVSGTTNATAPVGPYAGTVNAQCPYTLGDLRDSLFQFDLSAIPSGASLAALNASGAHVSSASMLLTEGLAPPSAAGMVNVHNVTSAWTEASADWTNQPTSDPKVLASFSNGFGLGTTNKQGFYTYAVPGIDLSTLVSGWVAGTTSNYGVLLEESDDNSTNFLTSEWTTVSQRPALAITYTLACTPGYADCNNDASDGCETHVFANMPTNCGTCN